jgi:DNA-binding transcriptional regulator YdaS (Cro superfamily)
MFCLRFENRDNKTLSDLVLESLWMSNGSREMLALVYGVHPNQIDHWLSGGRPISETYAYSIQSYHEHMRKEIKRIFEVSKTLQS